MKFLIFFLSLILVLVFLGGCSGTASINDNPPDYIKDLVIYREGYDAVVIYFVLADENGQETTADGSLNLKITLKGFPGEGQILVKEFSGNFKKEDFALAKVGSGAYERERIIYNFGRFKYSHRYDPSWQFPWTVSLTVKTGGKILRAEEKFF
jgi:hypothetical protein